MTIPSVTSSYPTSLDNDTNLYLVHDSLRVMLAVDYTPGNTSITIYDADGIIGLFPPTGVITLTEQCNDIDERAISFYYGSRTDTTFNDLELLPEFTDVLKPKNFTNVTMNVMDRHHNAIKNAIIAVETFVGVKGTTDVVPFGPTIEGRLNFLLKLVFTPKAWFSANKTIGLVPFTVVFHDESFRLGEGAVAYTWDFGDNTSSNISISTSPSITDLKYISHTYYTPSHYDVTLLVSNSYGVASVTLPEFINARIPAPDAAVIDFVGAAGQIITPGSPAGGPYTTPPTIRSATDTLVSLDIQSGVNPATGRTYAGEEVVGTTPIDPIEEYTWSLGDDLTHANQSNSKALYSLGGIYDLILRTDTSCGSYRITKYDNCVDMVESQNIWLWTMGVPNPGGGYDPLNYLSQSGDATANEFGLLSETFKTGSNTFNVVRSEAFLNGTYNEWQAKTEFRKNVGFNPTNTSTSGSSGSANIYWASQGCATPPPGVAAITDHEIKITEFNGFADTYASQIPICQSWNWLNLNSSSTSYFVFGADYNQGSVPFHNYSNQIRTDYNLLTRSYAQNALTLSSYTNGAQDLIEYASGHYDIITGIPDNGYFAVYRSAWKDSAGYFIRNGSVGNYFRLNSFYKTEGTLANEFQTITKLTDMTGPVKTEGQLVALSDGLFFFNNSGNISAYNTSSNTWETGGASVVSATFRSLQDTSVMGFEDFSNTLLATTDGDRQAYLSYDYSPYAFIKFSSLDLAFYNIGPRPGGSTKTQFLMGMY